MVPPGVAALIRERQLFGYLPEAEVTALPAAPEQVQN